MIKIISFIAIVSIIMLIVQVIIYNKVGDDGKDNNGI